MNKDLSQYYRNRYRKRRNRAWIFAALIFIIMFISALFIGQKQGQKIFILFLGLVLALLFLYLSYRDLRIWKRVFKSGLDKSIKSILETSVDFYNKLDQDEKIYFEQRIAYFLESKQITGVNCEIDDRIKTYVAASAIMPIFSFPKFFYRNINEILIYPDSFDEQYNISNENERKRIAGMVGSGAMNRMMILSKRDLAKAFDDRIDADNVAIHEFVHLIDMTDGKVDGIPQTLLQKSFTLPWIAQMHREMKKIRRRRSDISTYALTNEGEFLAVVSEYFFDSPVKMKARHPDLYRSMQKMFNQNS